MASFAGFIGPTAAARSLSQDAQRTINLFLEVDEVGAGRNKAVLYGTPGSTLLATASESAYRGMLAADGRCYAVVGSGFYEVSPSGTLVRYGDIQPDAHPVQPCTSGTAGHQVAFVSGGLGYVFDTVTNTLVQINSPGFPAGAYQIGFRDATFFVLSPGGRVQESALLDALTWNAANFGRRSRASDDWISAIWVREQFWALGPQTGEVWYDAGTAGFALAAINGGFLEMGIAAPATLTIHNQQPTWLAQDLRGGRFVVQAQGVGQVGRISTHALETALASYVRVDDAVAWSETYAGHEFYVVTSRSWPTTWTYDASTKQWTERQSLDPATGTYGPQRGICHAYAYEQHLVGDYATGALYEQSLSTYTDGANPLPWLRRAPVIADGDQMVWHDRFGLITEPGLGLDSTIGSQALVSLRWSDDGGKTWGNVVTAGLGPLGAYRQRVDWRRLGGTRFGRVYEVSGTAAVKRVLIDAELELTKGTH